MAVVIAIDAGTTGVRAIAFDQQGLPTASRLPGVPPALPAARAGSSTTPTEIWDAVVDVLGEVGAAARDAGRDRSPRSASPTSARPSWPGTGAPAARCTGPSSGRTGAPPTAATSCATPATCRSCGPTTGLVLDPYFSGTKLEWLFTEGGVRPGPDVAVGTIDTWLIWKLTGGAVHATDATNASRTMLFDIRTRRLVARAVRAASACPSTCCPRSCRRAAASASPPTASPARRRRAHQRDRRRPAGLAVRPGLLRPRA